MATIADMYTDIAGLRAAIRDSVGYPSTATILPDSTITSLIARALARFNADFALVGIGTFATVANQQAYSPLPASAHGFRRVWWPVSGVCSSADYISLVGEMRQYLSGPIDEVGTYVIPDVSAVYDIVRRRTWLRRLADGGAQVVGRTVYLDPVPSDDGAAVFSYNGDRYSDPLDIAGDHIDAFLTLCDALAHERCAAGIGGVEQISDTSEGSVIRMASPRHHMHMAECKRAEYAQMRGQVSLNPLM